MADSTFDTPQYKRSEIPTEEKCVHSKLHDAKDELINFEEDYDKPTWYLLGTLSLNE